MLSHSQLDLILVWNFGLSLLVSVMSSFECFFDIVSVDGKCAARDLCLVEVCFVCMCW